MLEDTPHTLGENFLFIIFFSYSVVWYSYYYFQYYLVQFWFLV